MTTLQRSVALVAFCLCVVLSMSACKTSGANASLITNSSFSFSGQNYAGLTVLSSGTKPYVISASPVGSTTTALTLTFASGNPANGTYTVTPTSSNACIMNFSSNASGSIVNYTSISGTVTIATTAEGKRTATFSNVSMGLSTNPLAMQAISGTVIF